MAVVKPAKHVSKRELDLVKRLRGCKKKVEEHASAIAKHRDALRSIYHDIDDLAESCDYGMDELHATVVSLEQAIDHFSEYV